MGVGTMGVWALFFTYGLWPVGRQGFRDIYQLYDGSGPYASAALVGPMSLLTPCRSKIKL
jgi:hypothetical protein